jgi:hypothetical protein
MMGEWGNDDDDDGNGKNGKQIDTTSASRNKYTV